MLWLGVFLALDVSTNTPDAMCPPLEEAKAALRARVGDVHGDYHAEFELVRGDHGQALRLVLRHGAREVLQRELALDAAGCQDAAQAIALVLERYFDAVESPAEPSAQESAPQRPLERKPVAKATLPTAASADATSRMLGQAETATSFRVHTGFAYDYALGVAASLGMVIYPASWRSAARLGVGIGLELTPFFTRQTQLVREQELSAFSLQTAILAPLVWTRAAFAVSLGPWAQLRVQRAEGATLTNAQPGYRAVPGVGGFLRGAYWPSHRWGVVAGLAAGGQLLGSTPRFALERDSGASEVLAPASWFGVASLGLELAL